MLSYPGFFGPTRCHEFRAEGQPGVWHHDVAIVEFKQAVEIPQQPDPSAFIRLAAAYNDNKQPDEALAVLAKMPANPQLAPFIAKEKQRADALKAAKK